MLLALATALAIVAQDRTPLRAAPRPQAIELTQLLQGEVLEVREERAGYLRVYDYHRERGGYVKSELVHPLGLAEADAPALLAVLRFLRDGRGTEALGISYGAAYLKAAPPSALTAEPFNAIAGLAERLAESASLPADRHAEAMAHLAVVEQFGIHTRSFEHNGRIQVCYDGELFHRVLALPRVSAEERARALLGLTHPECIDPAVGLALRAAQDLNETVLLDSLDERGLTPMTLSRIHARRAAVWSAVAYEEARGGRSAAAAAQRALAELLAVHPGDLGDERRGEYLDALLRVGAIRWGAAPVRTPSGPLILTAAPGAPGQTCVSLADAQRPGAALLRRCTYGIVWTASAQVIAQGTALVLAVQPLETWRELWVFHAGEAGWTVDVLAPGVDDPDEGYVEFAGFAPRSQRLLVAREVREHGRFRRRFEELRLADLLPVKQASSPELLADFGRWQDVTWRRDTLALH
jgi:hypothetical protein